MVDGSVGYLFRFCANELREREITETPELEARLLIEGATSLSLVEQILYPKKVIDATALLNLEKMLAKRLEAHPIAYILGYKEFYGRLFSVDERVLIPRPDTETLVEVALAYAKKMDRELCIVDVCTGSGCVGITLACELGYDVLLSDISKDALDVATSNAVNLIGHELPTIQGDLLSTLTGKYDIIVSNPPYLTEKWCDEVNADVKREPRLALEGFGLDGLTLIRTLVKQSALALTDGGALMVECDYRQSIEVEKIMLQAGFTEVTIEYDLAGKERVVWGIHNCTNN